MERKIHHNHNYWYAYFLHPMFSLLASMCTLTCNARIPDSLRPTGTCKHNLYFFSCCFSPEITPKCFGCVCIGIGKKRFLQMCVRSVYPSVCECMLILRVYWWVDALPFSITDAFLLGSLFPPHDTVPVFNYARYVYSFYAILFPFLFPQLTSRSLPPFLFFPFPIVFSPSLTCSFRIFLSFPIFIFFPLFCVPLRNNSRRLSPEYCISTHGPWLYVIRSHPPQAALVSIMRYSKEEMIRLKRRVKRAHAIKRKQ